ncbi:MAG: hypothetical protein L0212_10705 [Acidobacteria bacterium]|nr:hypothetical protein [Acidobacteriota bacterium]
MIEQNGTALVDLRAARSTPLEQAQLIEIRKLLAETIRYTAKKDALERIERAGNAGVPPPILESCLIDPEVTPVLKCHQQWLPAEVDAFRTQLFPALEKLACESSWIAGGLIRQIHRREPTSGRFGLAGRYTALLDKQECEGLSSLPWADKNHIRDLAKDEEEEHQEQSGAGKPAEEAPASPIPPATP